MPSPPISPTSLSPSSKMASLASILHRGSSAAGAPTTTTRSTSSKSTPAPISTSSPTGAQQRQQQQHYQHTSPPPPGAGAAAPFPPPGLAAPVHPLSPTTVETAAHVAIQDLPFYHQLEQVQRVRDGKFPASAGGGAAAAAAAAAPLEPYHQTDAGAADEASSASLTPTAAGPAGRVFERQIEEVEEAKEVLRKAGVVVGGAGGQWGGQQDVQVKVQVQGDGHAKMRIMGAAEEADRDEGVRV